MKRVITGATLLVAVAALLGALSLKPNGVKAAPAHAVSGNMLKGQPSSVTCVKWSVVPSPNASGFNTDGLSGVATISSGDIWAVGGAGNQRSGGDSLIEHWNGRSWQIVPSPNPGSRYNFLYSVTAISSTDIWAAGLYASGPSLTQTLFEHWDGASWSVVPSPNPGNSNNEIFSVSADSASDIWAVGFTDSIGPDDQTSPNQTLIEHWDGTAWSVVPSPNPGTSNDTLEGVAAISANDAWAVGTGVTDAGATLTEHWNGAAWSVVPSPSPNDNGDLRAVTAISSDDVWAVGQYIATTGATLTEHWNGSSWSVVPSPSVGANPNLLLAVSAVSSTDVWTVGSVFSFNTFTFQTLAEHWNGTSWSIVPSPTPAGPSGGQLTGVSPISASNVWAVGGANGTTLTEHYAFSCLVPTR